MSDDIRASIIESVGTAARAARAASPTLAAAPDEVIDVTLQIMAGRLRDFTSQLLLANTADLEAAALAGLSTGLADRLRLDTGRIAAMAEQLESLAALDQPAARTPIRDLPGGLVLQEWRRPVGVVGANFEARPNVAVDVASQLIKSRNAGVLRTGSAAIGSASALVDHVVAPALEVAGLPADAIQMLRTKGRDAAQALAAHARLMPLVILRGSGESTRSLAELAATHGVRTLAHADGGGVLYIDVAADVGKAHALVDASLDRLGVCN